VNIFFDYVFKNFSRYANEINNGSKWKGLLLLTEMKNVNQFGKIKDMQAVGSGKKFKVENTGEDKSVKIISPEGNIVFVVNGKQIIAENNMEVLALCTNVEFSERQNLITTVKKINTENALAVLPWGVGKWTGKRKEMLEKFISEYNNEKFFLGDNSGRPKFWSEPDLFKAANLSGHYVLPGTDALSIENQISKTATYGFYVYDNLDDEHPAKSIKNIIENLDAPPKHFGTLESLVPFFKNQITMQLNKRRK
jgi:hypothetical protein